MTKAEERRAALLRRLRSHYEPGMTDGELARALRCNATTVASLREVLGLPRGVRPPGQRSRGRAVRAAVLAALAKGGTP